MNKVESNFLLLFSRSPSLSLSFLHLVYLFRYFHIIPLSSLTHLTQAVRAECGRSGYDTPKVQSKHQNKKGHRNPFARGHVAEKSKFHFGHGAYDIVCTFYSQTRKNFISFTPKISQLMLDRVEPKVEYFYEVKALYLVPRVFSII